MFLHEISSRGKLVDLIAFRTITPSNYPENWSKFDLIELIRNTVAHVTNVFQHHRCWDLFTETEPCIPITNNGCNVRSKIWWFTESCNSHYVSHFAAFFIVLWAKRSIVKWCGLFKIALDSTAFKTVIVLIKKCCTPSLPESDSDDRHLKRKSNLIVKDRRNDQTPSIQ